jgi:hypothetical protein
MTTDDVLLTADGFQVVGVHASTVPAKVVDLKPVWNGTDVHLVGDPVGLAAAATVLDTATLPKVPVSALAIPLPIPTSVISTPEVLGFKPPFIPGIHKMFWSLSHAAAAALAD